MTINPRIIIIGGNAAGPAAAAKAKRINPEAEVIMFEASEFISTGTCEIPYALSGDIKDYKQLLKFDADSFFKRKGVKVYTQYLVENIDPVKKMLRIRQLRGNRIKEEKYDKLIIATGSVPLDTGFGTACNLFTLKNISDFLKVRDYIDKNKVKDVIIVGAGFIGIEAAEAMHTLGYNITLLEKNTLPLPSSEPEIQSLIFNKLKEKNISFYTVQNAKPFFNENKITSVKVDGRIVDCDLVISAVGFKPNISLTDELRIRKGETGALKTDRQMRTSLTDIYAAGDLIEVSEHISGRGMYIPLAGLAYQSGHIAGENAAGGNILMDNFIKNISMRVFDNFFVNAGLTSWEAKKFNLFFDSVESFTNNYNGTMPGSQKIYGKLLYLKNSKKIIGASFFGGRETEGYGNLISAMIKLNQSVDALSTINYTYTPPLAPMKNLISALAWKVKDRN